MSLSAAHPKDNAPKRLIDRTTLDKRYFETVSPSDKNIRYFIKRSLSTHDPIPLDSLGRPTVPAYKPKEQLLNEALAIAYVKRHTSIPVPNVITTFEDQGCFYLVEEFFRGSIIAAEAPKKKHGFIRIQLEGFVAQLEQLKSKRIESFVPDTIFFPARMESNRRLLGNARYVEDENKPYHLCHGDLSWANVLVDPKTFKVLAVIDWEFAGFYPHGFEGEYWKRLGRCAAEEGEVDDTDKLVAVLYSLRIATPEVDDDETIKKEEEVGHAEEVMMRRNRRPLKSRVSISVKYA
jgi:hypothetical protein